MPSDFLRMIAALVSWSACFLSTIMTYQRATEGDDLGDDVPFKFWFMLSVGSLTACICCLTLMDMGEYVRDFTRAVVVSVGLAGFSWVVPFAGVFDLIFAIFFLGVAFFFIFVALFCFLCASVGCIQSCISFVRQHPCHWNSFFLAESLISVTLTCFGSNGAHVKPADLTSLSSSQHCCGPPRPAVTVDALVPTLSIVCLATPPQCTWNSSTIHVNLGHAHTVSSSIIGSASTRSGSILMCHRLFPPSAGHESIHLPTYISCSIQRTSDEQQRVTLDRVHAHSCTCNAGHVCSVGDSCTAKQNKLVG